MSEVDHGARLARVEDEVGGIKGEVVGLKAQMRGFSDILNRIEAGVTTAQQRFDDDKLAARINPIALATVLISIISILVGGSWLVSGAIAREDERSVWAAQQIERMDQRQWQGAPHGVAPAETHP